MVDCFLMVEGRTRQLQTMGRNSQVPPIDNLKWEFAGTVGAVNALGICDGNGTCPQIWKLRKDSIHFYSIPCFQSVEKDSVAVTQTPQAETRGVSNYEIDTLIGYPSSNFK